MSIEGSQWPGQFETSNEDKDSKKQKRGNKPPESRWVRPPLFHAEQAPPRPAPEAPLFRPPIPLEKISLPSVEVSKEEDDDDSGEEAAAAPETVTAEVTEAESPVEGPGESPERPDVPEASELLDIPHVDEQGPYTPYAVGEGAVEPQTNSDASQTFNQQSVNTFAPGSETPNPEPWESISGSSPFSWEDRTPPPAAAQPDAGPSWRAAPETPAVTAESTSSTPDTGGSSKLAAVETAKAVKDLAEIASNPYPLVTRVLTELAVAGYLRDRKENRYRTLEKQLHQRDEQLQHIQQQQQRANEQLSARINQAEAAQQAPAQAEKILDREGNEIALQPGWRVERGAAGYSVVLDEHGRVVHDAIQYGEAYKREQQREQLSDDLFNAISGGGAVSTAASDSSSGEGTYVQPAGSAAGHQGLGYQPEPHETADLRHRLPKPRRHARDAITSPWLWTAVAFLIIVYFVASLA